jgi:hypothetical protein
VAFRSLSKFGSKVRNNLFAVLEKNNFYFYRANDSQNLEL